MGKAYDTRDRAEILAAPHFEPFLKVPQLKKIGVRELRTLDRFFVFAGQHGVKVPTVDHFLAFVVRDSSPRQLVNLRTAFDRLLPNGSSVLRTIRDAIRVKRPLSRACDWRDRATLVADPLMAPYRTLATPETIDVEHLRVFVKFLEFAEAGEIAIPTVDDYLSFSDDTNSSRRLRALRAAIEALMPGNPAAHIVLAEAIKRKAPSRAVKEPRARPAPLRRVPVKELPDAWSRKLREMRLGICALHERTLSPSVIDSMEDMLREYAKVQVEAGCPSDITIEGIRRLEAARTAKAEARANARYTLEGDRPATRHTAVMRLRQFGEALGLDPLTMSAIQAHEKALRRELSSVVPLKFARLDSMPGLAETWRLASSLLEQSEQATRRQTKLRLLNEAFCLAFWALIPLRLGDGQLRWGGDIGFDGARYRIEIVTAKAEQLLRGQLNPRLQPFLDALVLRGLDPLHLEHLRDTAIADGTPLLRDVDGRMLSRGYPSAVWRRHMGTGAHIARSRVHTELGQLGSAGVEMALALAAQRNPRTAAHYQGVQVARALRERGQAMIDDLLADVMKGL